MKFSVSKNEFTRLLYLASTIVEKRNTMPILANVKLEAKDDVLQANATDLEISLQATAPIELTKPGSVTVAAKVLFDIVRELPDEKVSVELVQEKRISIKSGKSAYSINATSGAEFPKIVGTTLKNPISVDASKLFEMIEKTSYAISADETRYNINGVLLETIPEKIGNDKQTLRFVSTDGHRLCLIDRPAEGLSLERPVIIPRKGIGEIKKLLEGNEGAASISVADGYFSLQSGSGIIGVRLVDGNFPEYSPLFPSEFKTVIEVDREKMLNAVRRVSLVSTDKSKTEKFLFSAGTLTVSSVSPEYGEAVESLETNQTGEDVAIGFSSRYILDIFSAMSRSETIQVKLSGSTNPGLFVGADDENYRCIVMPMRYE